MQSDIFKIKPITSLKSDILQNLTGRYIIKAEAFLQRSLPSFRIIPVKPVWHQSQTGKTAGIAGNTVNAGKLTTKE
ncbi:MAG: hypothetical protein KC553_13050 [Nitrospina sp.]|nr:hypothetical protein [Nitrospina sp.]